MDSGRSERPGRMGAMPTPALTPARTSISSARSRARGGAVPGSVVRHSCSSSVGIEKLTETLARRAAACSTSMSRTTRGPRVMMPNGVRDSLSATMQARVRR